MHIKANKRLLTEMSVEEKLARTTPEAFAERGMLLSNFASIWRYITRSDYPYKDSIDHMIIRLTDDVIDNAWSFLALAPLLLLILQWYKKDGYTINRNQLDKQSVPREHIHLIKYK